MWDEGESGNKHDTQIYGLCSWKDVGAFPEDSLKIHTGHGKDLQM